ncbi:MAG: ABC transporter permease [Candidatus Rokuibacteriota bacterium]|nr:MAG: ABC transporter permease [Candidatus Rokubacteria bacterium]
MSVVEDDGAPAEQLSALEEFRRAPGAFIRQRPHLPLVPLVLVVFVLAWEGVVWAWRIPEFLVPAPSAIGRALVAGLTSRLYLDHFGVTLYESLLGFLIAAAAGIACGTLIAQFRVVEQTLYPYLVALQTLPKIAIAPLLIVWLGFGITSKVVIAALVAFFPILVNVIVGLKTVDASKLDLMRSLDASRWQTFRYVTFPNALPFVFAGLDIAIVFSVLGAIVGEFVGSQRGLGNLILQFHTSLDIAGMFAVLLLLAALGVGLHLAIQAIQRRVIFWAQADHIVGA